jgi:hypothetical protein
MSAIRVATSSRLLQEFSRKASEIWVGRNRDAKFSGSSP